MSVRRVPIADIAEIVTKGTTPTTLGREFTESGVNFIRAEALNGDSGLDSGGLSFIDEETHERLGRSILKEDDVLVTIAGAHVGRCGYVRAEHLPANTNQAVGIIRVRRDKAVPRFVYYFFKQPSTFALCQGLGSQSAQPNVNLAVLKSIQMRLPSMEIQDKTASILSAYDELIENNRRRIQLLEQAARLLYREWFVRLRFPGHEHVKIKDGVPEGWSVASLKDVAEVNRASIGNNYQGDIEYIDISAVSPGVVNAITKHQLSDAPSRARRIVSHGDIIWSCVRPNRRSYAIIWNPPENLIVSTGFAVISPLQVPTSFLYQALTTNEFVGYLANNARGAAYPAVTASDFEAARVLLPKRHLIDQFDEIASPVISQIQNLRQQSRKLAEARDLLLPRLMNGEIAV